MKKLTYYLIILSTIAIAVACDYYFVPVAWTKMTEALNSFSSKIYGIGLFFLLVPNGIAIWFLILEYESFYKKRHHYDIVKRKWVKNN